MSRFEGSGGEGNGALSLISIARCSHGSFTETRCSAGGLSTRADRLCAAGEQRAAALLPRGFRNLTLADVSGKRALAVGTPRGEVPSGIIAAAEGAGANMVRSAQIGAPLPISLNNKPFDLGEEGRQGAFNG